MHKTTETDIKGQGIKSHATNDNSIVVYLRKAADMHLQFVVYMGYIYVNFIYTYIKLIISTYVSECFIVSPSHPLTNK